MLTSFTLSIQPHPSSEWRDDRALTALPFGPHPPCSTIPKTPGPTNPPFLVCKNSPMGGLSILRACQSSGRPKYQPSSGYCNRISHQASMIGQNLCKPPHCCKHPTVADGWLHSTKEATEGMRQKEKSTNQTNNPESKTFHFPSTLLATLSTHKVL